MASEPVDDHEAWFVRFDDLQAMRKRCVTVRRTSEHVLAQRTAC
jgi:hypothetical protein